MHDDLVCGARPLKRALIINADDFGRECARQYADDGWLVDAISHPKGQGFEQAEEHLRHRYADRSVDLVMINLRRWPPVIDFDAECFEETSDAWGEVLAESTELALLCEALLPVLSDGGRIVLLGTKLPPVEPNSPSSIPVQVAKEAMQAWLAELDVAASKRRIALSWVDKDKLGKRGEKLTPSEAVAHLRRRIGA